MYLIIGISLGILLFAFIGMLLKYTVKFEQMKLDEED